MSGVSLGIRGSVVALVTPMFPDGAIDWLTYRELINWHIEEGTDALVIMGSTGESPTIPPTDHVELIRVAVDHAAGRIPVIGGTGANSTSEAIDLTHAARDVGVSACLSVVPYYNKPTQAGMYQHFRAVAESCEVPIILYDVPSRTNSRMSVETILALADVDGINGLKDATADLGRANELFHKLPSEFSVFSGDDATAAALILMGAQGNISVTANILPRLMRDLCAAALRGDIGIVREMSRRLASINQALFIESNPIPVKWAMSRMGMIHDGLRLPLTQLSPEHVKPVESAMQDAGIWLSRNGDNFNLGVPPYKK
ncbi:4-hydroxy-tetrahydrodipicolinate synthase [Pseudomonas moorei]|nr:4-hydroxy-tetrahydrodipicolinate synthase [Pseudomonas moorei]